MLRGNAPRRLSTECRDTRDTLGAAPFGYPDATIDRGKCWQTKWPNNAKYIYIYTYWTIIIVCFLMKCRFSGKLLASTAVPIRPCDFPGFSDRIIIRDFGFVHPPDLGELWSGLVLQLFRDTKSHPLVCCSILRWFSLVMENGPLIDCLPVAWKWPIYQINIGHMPPLFGGFQLNKSVSIRSRPMASWWKPQPVPFGRTCDSASSTRNCTNCLSGLYKYTCVACVSLNFVCLSILTMVLTRP